MIDRLKRTTAQAVTLSLLAAAALPAWAQSEPWPTQPVKIILPFAAGGATDVLARSFTDKLSAVLKLPVVYVCQNNQFAISTPSQREHGGRIVDRAAGFGMPGVAVDGNDVVAVHAAVQEAIARARRGEGPTLIDALTYRVGGHMASDPAAYRTDADVQAWKARDPIALHEARLLAEGLLDAAQLAVMSAEVAAEVDAAMRKAQSDPMPGPEDLGLDEIFAKA